MLPLRVQNYPTFIIAVMVISAALLIVFLRVCNRFAFNDEDDDDEGLDRKPGK